MVLQRASLVLPGTKSLTWKWVEGSIAVELYIYVGNYVIYYIGKNKAMHTW